MIRQGFVIFILFSMGLVFPQKINLNSATIEEMQLLDLTDRQIESIIEYQNHTGNIHDIYELLQIPGITTYVLLLDTWNHNLCQVKIHNMLMR